MKRFTLHCFAKLEAQVNDFGIVSGLLSLAIDCPQSTYKAAELCCIISAS